MTRTPGEPISDGDAPTGDPDLAPHEQPDPGTEPQPSPDREDSSATAPVDADEGDPPDDAYPG